MSNEYDHARDRDHETRRKGQVVAPTPKAGALAPTSLTALDAALSNLVRSANTGRSTKPLLSFRSREEGAWTMGRQGNVVEEGTTAAVNLASLMHGYICFSQDNQVLGEHLVPASQPKPLITNLPNHGCPWTDQLSVEMKFLDGDDADTEAVFKPTTLGGRDVIMTVVDTALSRIRSRQHEGKTVPIVRLGRDSYQHPKYSRVWVPTLDIVSWMSPEGPANVAPPPPPPAPKPAPTASAAEQPRRRRVA
jgi:hypothetical protein